MRKPDEPIKIIIDGVDVTDKYDMIVHSRINNCGTKLNIGEQPDLFDSKMICHCLSITNNRWIGNTGMSSYIVELIEKKP